MKTIASLIMLLVLNATVFSQSDQFRVDCNSVAILPNLTAEWSEWFEAQNTFVINSNDNNDIIHYRGDGSVVVYRNLGGLETAETKSGERYQILNVLDEEGNPISFQLFDDPSIGVKLISSEGIIQFSKF